MPRPTTGSRSEHTPTARGVSGSARASTPSSRSPRRLSATRGAASSWSSRRRRTLRTGTWPPRTRQLRGPTRPPATPTRREGTSSSAVRLSPRSPTRRTASSSRRTSRRSRSRSGRRSALQPVLRLVDRAQPDEARVALVSPRPPAPVAEMPLHHPPEERVAADEDVAPVLLVAAPELDVVADPVRRSPQQPARLDPEREVQPDDRVGRADDRILELALVVAVDHPAARSRVHRRLDLRAELLGSWLAPIRAVVERIELDVRDAEPLRQLLSERRLARARGALDVDAPQPWS